MSGTLFPVDAQPIKPSQVLAGSTPHVSTTTDLFCGAGGITEGFRQAGYKCLYANDIDSFAIETFRLNHPQAWAECRPIEMVFNQRPGENEISKLARKHGNYQLPSR
ncbi:MAG: DNA cytosine methyltransferase [Terriglobales bacterium]